MSKLILLTGKAGVGKDTFAKEYLSDGMVDRFSIASHIKECARTYFHWDGEKDERGRQLLIDLGLYFRKYNETLLLEIVSGKILNSAFKPTFIWGMDNYTAIITDCRFDNEVEYFKRKFGDAGYEVVCYKLEREFTSELTEEQQKDPTEQGISEHLIDKVIKLEDKD